MPRVPDVSPATGQPTTSTYIHTTEGNFVDNTGRTLLLRGVNLSGSSKAPVGKPSYVLHEFWELAETGGESFIGRPLDLDDGSADVHLARLRGWGFNMLRFPVTWEALEHAGPGRYDYEFMDYTIHVLRKCKEYGFKVYMNPHQDIWARFSGGSGAPYWTYPACGINPRNFTATQAAIIHCEYPVAHESDPGSLPAMIWSTNYGRLAAQTIFTLFFAGRDFAPRCILDGQNIQDWLQSHYFAAFGEMADRIRDAGDLMDVCVIGWDSMNEPFEGLVGWTDLNASPQSQGSTLKKGSYPTPSQGLRLGMGQAQTVEHWNFSAMGPRRDGTVTIDPKGRTIWVDPDTEPDGVHPRWGWKRDKRWKLGTCIWAQHGVWDVETGYILRPDYFLCAPDSNEPAEFIDDYWRPHFRAFGARIRRSHPEAILFVQPPVFARPPELEDADLKGRGAYSGHYYDGLTLITRHWNWFNADALGLLRGKYKSTLSAVKVGEGAIRKSLQEQLGMLKDDALLLAKGELRYPTIIGEIGTPFDMDGKRSYGWTDNGKYLGDYTNQQKALDASLNAADGPNAINYTVWTYCPDHSHAWGDGWNMEDLSLWSSDDLLTKHRISPGQESKVRLMQSQSGLTLERPRLSNSAATSALSLSTLPGAYESTNRAAAMSSIDSWSNPYDFLTDGARAVKAFSRPFPMAVVGVTTDIQFTIAKAEFSMKVLVRFEDALNIRGHTPSSFGSDKDKLPGTEIFVPLIHYARDKYLGKAQREQKVFPEGVEMSPTSTNESTMNLSGMLPREASPTSTLVNSPAELLALDVTVSAGLWEVDGQTLRWWYPVPAPGEPPIEQTITITRAGGAIRAADEAAAGGWFDSLCPPEGCTVM